MAKGNHTLSLFIYWVKNTTGKVALLLKGQTNYFKLKLKFMCSDLPVGFMSWQGAASMEELKKL